jgi:hypothetical protein
MATEEVHDPFNMLSFKRKYENAFYDVHAKNFPTTFMLTVSPCISPYPKSF